MIFMLCVLAACANQEQQSTSDANQPDYYNEIRNKIVSLEEEGIFLKGMSYQDNGVIHISLYNADQRVIRRIKEVISDEVDYLIWNEDDSILYVRGIIKVISPKSTSQIYDRIFVEGLKEEDTECNSAYVYVRDYTKIVKLRRQLLLGVMINQYYHNL